MGKNRFVAFIKDHDFRAIALHIIVIFFVSMSIFSVKWGVAENNEKGWAYTKEIGLYKIVDDDNTVEILSEMSVDESGESEEPDRYYQTFYISGLITITLLCTSLLLCLIAIIFRISSFNSKSIMTNPRFYEIAGGIILIIAPLVWRSLVPFRGDEMFYSSLCFYSVIILGIIECCISKWFPYLKEGDYLEFWQTNKRTICNLDVTIENKEAKKVAILSFITLFFILFSLFFSVWAVDPITIPSETFGLRETRFGDEWFRTGMIVSIVLIVAMLLSILTIILSIFKSNGIYKKLFGYIGVLIGLLMIISFVIWILNKPHRVDHGLGFYLTLIAGMVQIFFSAYWFSVYKFKQYKEMGHTKIQTLANFKAYVAVFISLVVMGVIIFGLFAPLWFIGFTDRYRNIGLHGMLMNDDWHQAGMITIIILIIALISCIMTIIFAFLDAIGKYRGPHHYLGIFTGFTMFASIWAMIYFSGIKHGYRIAFYLIIAGAIIQALTGALMFPENEDVKSVDT